jgi:Nicastrin
VQVIEFGQLGRGRSQEVAAGSRQQEAAGRQAGEGPARFYVHTQRGASFGDTSALADALQAAGNATQQVSPLQTRREAKACKMHGKIGQHMCLAFEVVMAQGQQPAWRKFRCAFTGRHTSSVAQLLSERCPSDDSLPQQAGLLIYAVLAPQAVVAAASRSNPGVPPGSLFSFLRAKPLISAAALTDFDSAFRNRFYGSRFDNGSNADIGSVAAAAAVAARALHALAAGPEAAPLQVQQYTSAWRSGNKSPAVYLTKLDVDQASTRHFVDT